MVLLAIVLAFGLALAYVSSTRDSRTSRAARIADTIGLAAWVVFGLALVGSAAAAIL